MTANELADELQKLFVGEEYDRLVHEIPDLLRQQAQEIKNLRQELALQKLSDISQEIDNEPVAWMLLGLEDRKPKLINLQVIDHLEGTWIPLYTHPMRELTDEEIGQFKGQWYRGDFNSFYDLVKAILKKASEK